MKINRTFHVCGHFCYEAEMPRSWPDDAVYDLQIQVINGKGNCVFIHPNMMPVLYDQHEKTYRTVRFDSTDGSIRELHS